MTLTELRYIVALAQERHFGRAAARCFVSQPTLSFAVQRLEAELAVVLFERGKNVATLTSVGEKIVSQAQRALEETERIKIIAQQGGDQLSGPLKLGVIPTVGPYILPSLIPILHRRAPAMPLEIEETITANLEDLLTNGTLDAVVVALPFNIPGIVTEPLYDEPFKAIVPKGHFWEKRVSIKASELAGQNLLLLRAGHCFRGQVIEACPNLSQPETTLMQGNSLETIRNMVASGLGMSVLPCSALTPKHESALVVTLDFDRPVPCRRIVLAWRKSYTRPVAIQTLRASIAALRISCLMILN